VKGIVFNIFSDLVTDKFGLDTWDALIERTHPASQAIYTSSDVYPDGELMAYVGELSKITRLPGEDLVRAFGNHMMHTFQRMHPEFMQGHTARSFLLSLQDVIHVEVKKLHPDTLLPTFEYESTGDGQLTMYYSSPRRLCHLAEGLIAGAGEVFQESIHLTHPECMHHGASRCRLDLRFG
jgi:hypothetical protein